MQVDDLFSVEETDPGLAAVGEGARDAESRLWSRVYDELQAMARQQMVKEPGGQTLQPTALVHEAYLRLVGTEDCGWDNRGHFFAAAAEAMRRILIERARKRHAAKRGGGKRRLNLDALEPCDPLAEGRDDEILALDEALEELACHDAAAAELVKLRFFGGLTHQEAAKILGLSRRQADGIYAVARSWLYRWLNEAQ